MINNKSLPRFLIQRNISFLITGLIITCVTLPAQDFSYSLDNRTYRENIRTVQFHREGWPLSNPVIELNSGEKLKLSFDEIGNDSKNFYYTFIHCNADWTETDLPVSEYLTGFYENQITEYAFSFNTKINYTHYSLIVPNNDVGFALSGNYVIRVYEDYDQEKVVLERRFHIYEPVVAVNAKVKRPSMGMYRDKYQEIDFTVLHEGYPIDNPMQDIKVTIRQNNRWDNAITNLKPVFIRNNELVYDDNEKNLFLGGSEFRYFDIKSLRYQSEYVKNIEFDGSKYVVTLVPDEARPYNVYFYNDDINGNYLVKIQEETNSDTDADYVEVKYILPYEIPEIEGDMYIFGALNNWHCNDRNRMSYNFDEKQYEGSMLLKQGYYNYAYAFLRDNSKSANLSIVEGSHYEAENDYTIYIYHKPYGLRYDRLIGIKTINSLK